MLATAGSLARMSVDSTALLEPKCMDNQDISA